MSYKVFGFIQNLPILKGANSMLAVNRQKIPTSLTREEFDLFVLPHLSRGSRGPEIKINYHKVFNYLLYLLHTGCQWKNIPIDKDEKGNTEIHHTRLFRIFKRWASDGSILKAFTNSVFHLDKHKKLDIEILHGDGTTTSAKKGGDLTGFNGHKKIFGSKIVAIVDRNVNIICPFTVAAGNVNETTLLGDAISQLKQMFTQLGRSLEGIVMSLDSGYDSRKNRKLCFNHKMIPNIKEINRNRNKNKPGPKRIYEEAIFEERFRTVERAFAWEDKFRRLLIRFEFRHDHHFAMKLIGYMMINLRHFCAV